MGLEGLQYLQSLQLIVPYLPSSSGRMLICERSYLSSLSRSRNSRYLVHRLVHRSTLFGSFSNFRTLDVKGCCSADSDEFTSNELPEFIGYMVENSFREDFHDDEYLNRIFNARNHFSDVSSSEDVKDQVFDVLTIDGYVRNRGNMPSYTSFLPSKLEFLEPESLGIIPEPLDWPEREKIARMDIERRVNNSVDIPLSLRMIKKKRKVKESFAGAGDFACCSVKKAFSSMVFIIRELHSYALCVRESLCSEDLQRVLKNVHMELNVSFVWLFQQVFARTPNLMVYVMLLLANFTVRSMVSNTAIAANPSPMIYLETITDGVLTVEEKDQEQLDVEYSAGNNNGGGKEIDQISGGSEGGDWKCGSSPHLIPNVAEEIVEVSLPENQGMTQEGEEVVGLWNSVLEEASSMQSKSGCETLDNEIRQRISSSESVELEPDDYVEYHRTDLFYQMEVADDPNNALLLANYAQFLSLVPRDYDRAEECFKRAAVVEPQDAMVLSRYADFLWRVRKDLWGAEERYQQAMATEPGSHYHASKYADFLWSTGGIETCFLVNASHDNYNQLE